MNSRLPVFSAAILAGLLFVCGCTVGPDYTAPKMPVQVRAFTNDTAASSVSRGPWWERTDPALRALVELALRENRDIRSAEAGLREARALRMEANYAFLPAGTVSSSYSRQLTSALQYPGISREDRKQNVFEVGADAAWELDLFGRIRRAVEANEAHTGAADADLAQIRMLVAAEVTKSYVELALVQAAIPLQQQVLKENAAVLGLLERQVANGKVSRDKLTPAELDLSNAKAALNDLVLSERRSRNRLGVLTGTTSLPSSRAAQFPNLPIPSLAGDPVQILNQRPDVLSAERRLAATTAMIGFTRADYFPRLSLGASVGAQANTLSQLSSADANLYSLGPRLQWDLLNLHRTKARVRAAEARCEQALNAWENSVLLALEEIDNAQANLEACRDRLANRERSLASMKESLRIATLNFQEGLIDPVAYHSAKRDALGLTLEKLRAEGELANAVIFLQKSLATDR